MIDLAGAIDLHVHSAPDVYPRSVDDDELVAEAAAAGMSGLLLKSHHTLTADRATLAGKRAGDVSVHGGLVLNRTVGGLNPVAVETAVAFGARQIWMPTIHAAHCLRVAAVPFVRAEAEHGREGIDVLDETGGLTEDALAVLEIVRDADIALGTGHLDPVESLTLLEAARDLGLRRLVVTHPLMTFTRFTHDQMRAAAALGARLEFCALSCIPEWHDAVETAVTAAAIGAVGAEHCVLASDGGQDWNEHPARMLLGFARALEGEGVPVPALRTMLRDNPARVLGLA